MNVDSMDQSHRETKIKYETDLANLREQVAEKHASVQTFSRFFLVSCWFVTRLKQGVALTGPNTTGPPSRAAPW